MLLTAMLDTIDWGHFQTTTIMTDLSLDIVETLLLLFQHMFGSVFRSSWRWILSLPSQHSHVRSWLLSQRKLFFIAKSSILGDSSVGWKHHLLLERYFTLVITLFIERNDLSLLVHEFGIEEVIQRTIFFKELLVIMEIYSREDAFESTTSLILFFCLFQSNFLFFGKSLFRCRSCCCVVNIPYVIGNSWISLPFALTCFPCG